MQSYLATPSGIQMEILTTLKKHKDGLPQVYLAKMIGKPERVVADNLEQMEKADVIEVNENKVVRVKGE